MIRDAHTVQAALGSLFGAARVTAERSVGGGCISGGRCVELSDGTRVFVKENRSLPGAMFVAEAEGLLALRSRNGPRVPEPLACSGQGRFLIMEWIETGRPRADTAERLGTELAALHREEQREQYGFDADNYIGSTPQENGWADTWPAFVRDRRLAPQLERAAKTRLIDGRTARAVESIMARIGELLPERPPVSLLHGDLWGGNWLAATDGAPVLIDPAVYYGDREADLAMTELFGGFSPAFYAAYREAWPLASGYRERADLYNLYHMLNHLNLFGGSYLSSVRSLAQKYG